MNDHRPVQGISAIRRARRQLAAIAAVGVVAAVSITLTGPAAGASAAGTANLSVRQVVSNGTGPGNTTVTDHIHNAGPATATNIVATAFLRVSGVSVSYTTSTSPPDPVSGNNSATTTTSYQS
jgi:hypothetical protein